MQQYDYFYGTQAEQFSFYLRDEGRNDIWIYGIAFYKKDVK